MPHRMLALGLFLCSVVGPVSAVEEGGGFTVIPVADRVWRIDDRGADNIYLVAGTQKALLVDTGLGQGDLAKVVRSLTALPVVVVVTHGHRDHAGGVGQFAEVHGHPADLDRIQLFDRPGKEPVKLVPVQEGFVFDLGGGRRLTVVATPGHTRGSICLLAPDLGLLFSGDNDNPLQWQFLPESTALSEYLRMLQALDRREGFDTVLPGHGERLDRIVLRQLAACVESVLDGSCRDEPYSTFIGEVRLCRRGRVAVAFDPARVR